MSLRLGLRGLATERLRPGLAARLTMGFGVTLLLLVLVTSLAVLRMNGLSQQMGSIVNVNNKQAALAKAMFDAVNDNYAAMLGVVVVAEAEDRKYQLEVFDRTRAEYVQASKRFADMLAQGPANASMQQQFERIAERERALSGLTDQARDMVQDPSRREQVAAMVSNSIKESYEGWQREIKGLYDATNEASANATATAQASIASARVMLLVVTAAALALGLAAAIWISRSVTRPIREASEVAQRVSRGDLSQTVLLRGHDEGGLLLSGLAHMQEELRSLVGAVRAATGSIKVASTEIAAGNQELSDRTGQTAGRLQQVTASMEELTRMLSQSADTAAQASARVASAARAAQRGGEAAAQVVATMAGINARAHEIGEIVSVIDSIAFQTNILALNASVEAARAGEQGRGFAVVADEVRNLATRSAQAAQQIKTLIGASVERIASGAKQVESAGNTMASIVEEVGGVQEMITAVAAAAQIQRDRVMDVGGAMTDLDRMTQQNSALVEQLAAAAQSMREQAESLTDTVATFTLNDGESGSGVLNQMRGDA